MTLPPNGEYLIRYHGKYSNARPKQFWWRETVENDSDLNATLVDIEDHDDMKLECVLLVEFIDGKFSARNVTDEICELLDRRERERREETRDDNADRADHEYELRADAW